MEVIEPIPDIKSARRQSHRFSTSSSHHAQIDQDYYIRTSRQFLEDQQQQAAWATTLRTAASTNASNNKSILNWKGLRYSNALQCQADGADSKTTAFLLARLARENERLLNDPKAAVPKENGIATAVEETEDEDEGDISCAAPTDLEFWSAIVSDYRICASRLPNLVHYKIRRGIPDPLRGLVWRSMSGGLEDDMMGVYDNLTAEWSPYVTEIDRDLPRTFPKIDFFSRKHGEGQESMGKVLRAFSVYDMEVGYCQGLSFLVGPLLLHLKESEAFVVLVRLMEKYDLRTMFTNNMSGLRLRMFQFDMYFSQTLPDLYVHFADLGVQPLYSSQWFLSLFAVTSPLPMLFRIYDLMFAEGAIETLIRVAVALLQKNAQTLLGFKEEDEVMPFLLSRRVWDAYGYDGDALIDDIINLTGVATAASLAELEQTYRELEKRPMTGKVGGAASILQSSPVDLRTAANNFITKIFNARASGTPGSTTSMSSKETTLSFMMRSSSKSSLSSFASDDAKSITSCSSSSTTSNKSDVPQQRQQQGDKKSSTKSKGHKLAKDTIDLHNQIEDLLNLISGTQQEMSMISKNLENERRARATDRKITLQLVKMLQSQNISDETAAAAESLKERLVEDTNATRNRFSTSSSEEDDISARHDEDEESAVYADLAKDLSQARVSAAETSEDNRQLKAELADKKEENKMLREQLLTFKSWHSESQDDVKQLQVRIQEMQTQLDETRQQESSKLREFTLGRTASFRSSSAQHKKLIINVSNAGERAGSPTTTAI